MPEYNIVFGPPGTGKTSTLLNILEKEIGENKVPIDRIAFVSFSRAGAYDGKLRAATKFNVNIDSEDMKYFRTLHSLAKLYDRRSVLTEKRLAEFQRKAGYSFLYDKDDELCYDYLCLRRNNIVASARLVNHINAEKYNAMQKHYNKFKETFCLIDYDDLIAEFKGPIDVDIAIIDEAQDLTTLQWKMISRAFYTCQRVYIAGDDDQAIFTWSGADVNLFLKQRGEINILSKSYRLPNNIVDFARTITANIATRVDKVYTGNGSTGVIDYVNGLNEIIINVKESYLMLAQTQYMLNQYVEWLTDLGIKYKLQGELVVNDRTVEAINLWEYLRVQENPDQGQLDRFSRILKPTATFDMPWYEAFNWNKNKILSYMDTEHNFEECRINVTTITKSKGLEADNIIIITDLSKSTAREFEIMPDSLHRLFYVAVTRAKKTVTIVKPQTKLYYRYI